VTGPYTDRESFRPNAGAWPRDIRPEQKVRIERTAELQLLLRGTGVRLRGDAASG